MGHDLELWTHGDSNSGTLGCQLDWARAALCCAVSSRECMSGVQPTMIASDVVLCRGVRLQTVCTIRVPPPREDLLAGGLEDVGVLRDICRERSARARCRITSVPVGSCQAHESPFGIGLTIDRDDWGMQPALGSM